jgi:subtilisin family serine protease
MQVRRFLYVLVLLVFLAGLPGGIGQPGYALAQADEPPFSLPADDVQVDAAILTAFESQSSADYVIVMDEQADLSAAYLIANWDERGRYVYETLKATAERSQAAVIAQLERQGLAYQSFIAGNEIYVYAGSATTLQSVIQIEGVGQVRAPVEARLTVDFSLPQVGPHPQADIQAVTSWGLTNSQATNFWSTYNQTGEGIIVANIDTGVQYNHPALASAYRCAGGSVGSSTCWFDPTGLCPPGQPCDNHGHGTHTMGSIVGSNNPSLAYHVGMAPGATWIACKGCTTNNCPDAALNACADWMLAPGGNTSNRPHVVNNSWGGNGGNAWFLNKVTAWRAAGIFPVFSAGNSGPSCGTLGSPADYQVSFAVGNHTASGSISGSSSRGPSIFGSSPYTKPNLSAPGSSIVSSIPNNDWAYSSGTSMAAPHVAGAVALLWACSPDLRRQIDATFQVFQNTADTPPEGSCGVPDTGLGNNTFGYGYLNILSGASGRCRIGTLTGTVRNQATGTGIQGARVTASGSGGLNAGATTNSSGVYVFRISEGSYVVTATSLGYSSNSINSVSIVTNSTTTRNFTLTSLPPRAWLPLIRK